MSSQLTLSSDSLPSLSLIFSFTLSPRFELMKLRASPTVMPVMSVPATARMMSPASRPALSAGVPELTPVILSPPVSASLSTWTPRPTYWFAL